MLQRLISIIALLTMSLPVTVYASTGNLQSAVDALEQGAYRDAYVQLLPLAHNGNRDAQTLLGLIYSEGRGVEQDIKQARRWYLRAAEKGKTDAAFLLGLSYLNKYSNPEENANAVYWIKYAARRDSLSAQRFMALAYEKGWMNIKASDWKSKYWWERYEKLSLAKSN